MRKLITCRMATLVAGLLLFTNALAQVPVIPGAAGFGINTPAGRGGNIIRVTNLNDGGAGSLRACVQASGPRYCIFEVSGTINLNSMLMIDNPYVTIAGQTAPAPGIMLRGDSVRIRTSNVLLQHIASRTGGGSGGAYNMEPLIINGGNTPVQNVVIDHCSLSWTADENVSTYNSWDNVTISNSIISESLRDIENGYAALIEADPNGSRIALIGNLLAHNYSRNPRSGANSFVFVNNVVYNPGNYQIFLYNRGRTSQNSIVGNVFKNGPNTSAPPVTLDGSSGNSIISGSKLYLSDNLASGAGGNQWSMVRNQSSVSQSQLEASSAPTWPAGLTAMRTANDAVLNHVLANAGSRPAQRDSVDSRVVADARNGTGRIISCVTNDGSSRCANNAGGWPNMAANSRTLNVPGNPHGDDDNDGYTNIEEWLHSMAASVEGGSSSPPPSAPRPNPPQILN